MQLDLHQKERMLFNLPWRMLKIAIISLFFLANIAQANSITNNNGYDYCNHHAFTFLMFKAYDVSLCGNDPGLFAPEKIYADNFSLIIHYNMNFSKKELSKASIEEMNRYYDLRPQDQNHYFERLLSIFPDIKKNDMIEARFLKKGAIFFYHNHLLTGTINDPKFSKIFLDIWLYHDNKYQKMTQDLFKKHAKN